MKKGELPGRVVLVIAALACVATSAPKWYAEAPMPKGAPTGTKSGEGRGVVVVVDSSRIPAVRCMGSGWGSFDAPPIAESGLLAIDGFAPGPHTFLCPPGGTIHTVSIGEKGGVGGGLCSSPKPPPNEYVKIVSQETKAVWIKTVEKLAPIRLGAKDQLTTLSVQIRSPFTTTLVGHAEPASDQIAYAVPVDVARTNSDAGWGDRWSVVVTRMANTSQPVDTMMKLVATASGPCSGACTPPEGEITITVE